MSTSSLPPFGFSCPAGGKWYACNGGSNFVGCCGTDPCSTNCAQGSLYPASFNPTYHGKFSDASCPSGSNFWTCTGTSPVFMGCCKTDPCKAGQCAGDGLVPAFLGNDFQKQQYGAVAGSSTSSAASSGTATVARASTFATIATASPSTNPTSAAQTSPAAIQHKDGPSVAAIAGGAAGGAFAIALVIGLLIYYFCHAKKSRRGHEETVVRRESDMAAMGATPITVQGKGYGSETYMGSPDAPPSYMSPNPNDYYGAHAQPHAGRYHQYIPEPQEMPCDTQATGMVGFSGKPVGHQRNMSELSGDTAIRSEMESPHVGAKSTPVEPQAGWSSSPNGHSGSTWTPQQNWQTSTSEGHGHGPAQGLGLTDANNQTTTR